MHDRFQGFEGGGVAGADASIDDDREVDLGVQSINRTAMMAPMTRIAAAGFPNFAMAPSLTTGNALRCQTRAVRPARRSAAWSSVSCFLQNANRIIDLPRPLPVL
jgi:hypothetical protein